MAIFIPRKKEFATEKPQHRELALSNDINRDVVAVFDGLRDLHDGTLATLHNGAEYREAAVVIGDEVDDYADLGKPHTPAGFTVPFTLVMTFTPTKIGVWNRLYKSSASGDYHGVWLQVKSDNKVTLSYGDGGSGGPGARRTFDTNGVVELNKTVTIAWTITGATTSVAYLDGEKQVLALSGSGGALATSELFAQVGRTNEDGFLYGGTSKIALLSIYNSERSDDELKSLSEAPYQILKPRKTYFMLPSADVGGGFQALTGQVTFGQQAQAQLSTVQRAIMQADLPLVSQSIINLASKISGDVSLNLTPESLISTICRLTGTVPYDLSASANIVLSDKISGDISVDLAPHAAFGGIQAIIGSVLFPQAIDSGFALSQYKLGNIAFTLSTDFVSTLTQYIVGSISADLSSAAQIILGQKVTGDTAFALGVSSGTTLSQLLTGNVTLDLAANAIIALGAEQIINGDVTLNLTTNAGFNTTQRLLGSALLSQLVGSDITTIQRTTGAITMDLSPLSQVQLIQRISGVVDFAIGIASEINTVYKLEGSVSFAAIPNALLVLGGIQSIEGDVGFDLSPSAEFYANDFFTGLANFGISASAVMALVISGQPTNQELLDAINALSAKIDLIPDAVWDEIL